MTKTLLKLEACGHEIKVRSWGRPSERVDLQLDGLCLVVTGEEHQALLTSIAEKLAYALRAPERKKRARSKTTRLEVSTTPEGALKLASLVGQKLDGGITVLAVEPSEGLMLRPPSQYELKR